MEYDVIAMPFIFGTFFLYFLRWLQKRVKDGSVTIKLQGGLNADLVKENAALKTKVLELEACKKCNEEAIKTLQKRYFAEIDRKQLLSFMDSKNES